MQLAVLAPYNNLATSVAAALVPTLLGPAKLRALEDASNNKPDTNLISGKFNVREREKKKKKLCPIFFLPFHTSSRYICIVVFIDNPHLYLLITYLKCMRKLYCCLIYYVLIY